MAAAEHVVSDSEGEINNVYLINYYKSLQNNNNNNNNNTPHLRKEPRVFDLTRHRRKQQDQLSAHLFWNSTYFLGI